jgi:hypothetical protein
MLRKGERMDFSDQREKCQRTFWLIQFLLRILDFLVELHLVNCVQKYTI